MNQKEFNIIKKERTEILNRYDKDKLIEIIIEMEFDIQQQADKSHLRYC